MGANALEPAPSEARPAGVRTVTAGVAGVTSGASPTAVGSSSGQTGSGASVEASQGIVRRMVRGVRAPTVVAIPISGAAAPIEGEPIEESGVQTQGMTIRARVRPTGSHRENRGVTLTVTRNAKPLHVVSSVRVTLQAHEDHVSSGRSAIENPLANPGSTSPACLRTAILRSWTPRYGGIFASSRRDSPTRSLPTWWRLAT